MFNPRGLIDNELSLVLTMAFVTDNSLLYKGQSWNPQSKPSLVNARKTKRPEH